MNEIGNITQHLTQIIESVYRDGIDRLLTFHMEKTGTIKGKFLAHSQVYNFNISPNNSINYIEADSDTETTINSDSYLIGYQFDSGINFNIIRSDKKNGKKRCIQGKPCKDNCINKGDTCQSGLSSRSTSELAKLRLKMEECQRR